MKTRTYGLLLLVSVGLVPLGVFGYLAVTRAERAAIRQVRDTNQRTAHLVADRVGAYLEAERRLLASIGAAALLAESADEASAILQAYGLRQQHLWRMQVYRAPGQPWASQEQGEAPRASDALARMALAGSPARSEVEPADPRHAGAFAHTITLAEPVVIAGKRAGAIVAQMDLVGIWPPINAIRIGRTGFARLLTHRGELLAHGDPEERRFVFTEEPAAHAQLVAGALLGRVVANQQGEGVVASLAPVPGIDWMVVVEESVEEAFGVAAGLRRTLAALAGFALVAVLVLGVLFGRSVVRGLEELRAHTLVLARGELDARAAPKSRLVEVEALANSLNDMASSLQKLEAEARARDRMTTFARISAGLAHDLKAPIEAIRGAWEAIGREPTDGSVQELVRRVNERDLPRLKAYMDDLHRLAGGGEIDRDIVRVEPLELVADVVEDLRSVPKWSDVTFAVRGEAEAVSVDRKLVRRAIWNLAANGADACLEAADTGTVTIELDGAGEELAIRVLDTGRGITPDRVEKLATLDFASTKRSTGVGLGLGVVRQVAETHGGRLEISSEPGRGSTFTLVLSRSGRSPKRADATS